MKPILFASVLCLVLLPGCSQQEGNGGGSTESAGSGRSADPKAGSNPTPGSGSGEAAPKPTPAAAGGTDPEGASGESPENPDAPMEAASAEHAGLLDPSQAQVQAPDAFLVEFETSQGTVKVEVTRAWSPKGADRFWNLCNIGYFDGARIYRVVPNFVVQFGFKGVPEIDRVWATSRIGDDPRNQTNARGTIVFATSGPNTRTTQLFINLANNSRLDGMGFTPFGRVVEGMEAVDKMFAGYREDLRQNPNQGAIANEGNAYLDREFPKLDAIKSVRLLLTNK